MIWANPCTIDCPRCGSVKVTIERNRKPWPDSLVCGGCNYVGPIRNPNYPAVVSSQGFGAVCACSIIATAQDGHHLSSPTPAMIATFTSHTYTFEPKDDITAPELSKVFVAILPAIACRNVIGNGCDVTQNIEALPPEAKRHFVLHSAQ